MFELRRLRTMRVAVRGAAREVALAVGVAALLIASSNSVAAPKFSDWGTPVNLGPVINSAGMDIGPATSKDHLSLYFGSNRPGGFGANDIWVSQRASNDAPWGPPVNLGPTLNTVAIEGGPSFSPDGHWMFLNSDRVGGFGLNDLWVSYRADVHDDFAWQTPVNLGAGVNSPSVDQASSLFVSDDCDDNDEVDERDGRGLGTRGTRDDEEDGRDDDEDDECVRLLFFSSDRPGGLGRSDVYVSAQQPDGSFGAAVLVMELSSPAVDIRPIIRADGLELFLFSSRPGSLGGVDLWASTRHSVSDPWNPPLNLGATVNSPQEDAQAYPSSDGRTLYFSSTRPGGVGSFDLYVTTRTRVDDRDDDLRPSARAGHRMVYGAEEERVILFGGANPFGGGIDLNDMWAYDVEENEWGELHPSAMPPPSGPIANAGPMVYDSESERVILFQKGETWVYDFDRNAWKNKQPAMAPPVTSIRQGVRMAYDSESDRTILFGGREEAPMFLYTDTWAYDLNTNTWIQMHPAINPPGRHHFGMVYDSRHDRVVVFGGAFGGQRRGDTWAYDYNRDTWTLLLPGSGPSPRGFPGMVYDSCAKRVILFGGVSSVATGELTNDETWSYDYVSNTWTRLIPRVAPSARAWHAMAYVGDDDDGDCDNRDDDEDDEAQVRTLLFGGAATRRGPATDDLWTYDNAANTWALVGDNTEDDDDDDDDDEEDEDDA